MFKCFLFAVFCLASAAAAPGYLGGLAAAPAPAIAYGHAAPAISYGHALAAPSLSSYGLAAHGNYYASPALAHAPLGLAHAPLGLAHGHLGLAHGHLAAPAYSLGPKISYAAPAHLGLAHAPLAAAPLGLGYRSYAAPALAHGW